METEMDGLKDDLVQQLNKATISGGTVVGFLSEANIVAPGAATWLFDGDIKKVEALGASAAPYAATAPAVAGQVAVKIVRLDTYATIATVNITATDFVAGTITLDGAVTTIAGTICAVEVVDDNGDAVDVPLPQFIIGGIVDASQLINYPADVSLKTSVKAALRAVSPGYVFDDEI